MAEVRCISSPFDSLCCIRSTDGQLKIAALDRVIDLCCAANDQVHYCSVIESICPLQYPV